jgi:DNA-binding NtrC family response regulator
VVDDDRTLLETIRRGLGAIPNLDIRLCERGDQAVVLLEDATSFDLVLTDVRMPGATGHQVLRRVRELSQDIPVLLMSAVATVEEVMELQQAGATLFLRKPFSLPELQMMVGQAHHLARRLRLARDLDRVVAHQEVTLPGLIGRSPAFVRALAHLPALSRTEAPLLITGETGTGKELVARAAHALSPRVKGPFVAVNCSALTDTLVDSELFGHTKGAFTGALRDQPGLFRAAQGGTIFLDEIADLASTAQAKLLRVLQEKQVRPVGDTRSVAVDVRVVAATHGDLEERCKQGTFRQDLLFRLRVGELKLPPLRARPDDILLLAHHFLERARASFGSSARAFSPEAVAVLMSHPWPGNVRELDGVVTRAVAVATGSAVAPADLGLESTPALSPGPAGAALPPFSQAKQQLVDSFERTYLSRLLAELPQVTQAASAAGLDRKTLYRLLKKHGLSTGMPEEEQGPHPVIP